MLFYTDGSDLKEVKRFLDIIYIKWLRFFMKLNNAWPAQDVGDPPPPKWVVLLNHLVLFCAVLCLVTGLIYLRENIGKIVFFDLGHTYITVMMTQVSLSRHVISFNKTYRDVSKAFATKIHLLLWKDNSEYAMKIHLLVHKICHFFVTYLHVIMMFGILCFNLTPLYSNIRNDAFTKRLTGNATLEHAVYYWLPFDYSTQMPGYLGLFVFNWYMSLVCSINFCSVDVYMSVLVFHIWGHLKILIHENETFPRPKDLKTCRNVNGYTIQVEWFTEEENRQVQEQLIEIVKHHCLIMDFIKDMTAAFGYVLFIYLAFHQVCGCILLLECSSLEVNALSRYGLLTVIIFQQLIQISLIFELLGSMTNKLVDAVYNLPWECMETRHRMMVNTMLRQSQLPLRFKALGMVDVGGGTMVTILKTSLSYFLMLQTFTIKN